MLVRPHPNRHERGVNVGHQSAEMREHAGYLFSTAARGPASKHTTIAVACCYCAPTASPITAVRLYCVHA
eukprot:6178944-Pleurochrysis_carterae.AAC.3